MDCKVHQQNNRRHPVAPLCATIEMKLKKAQRMGTLLILDLDPGVGLRPDLICAEVKERST